MEVAWHIFILLLYQYLLLYHQIANMLYLDMMETLIKISDTGICSSSTCLRTFTGHTSKVGSVTFSPDGLYALSGSNDKTLKYWRISDGVCLRTFTGHTQYVNSVKFTPDGQYALSASSDSTIKHWRISDGTCIRTFTGCKYPIYVIAVSPDGKYVLSGAEARWQLYKG